MWIKLTIKNFKTSFAIYDEAVVRIDSCRFVFISDSSGGSVITLTGQDKDVVVKESPEEILVMIEGKGPPEEGRMKYHILDYKDEKRASFVFKADRNYSLKMMKRAYAENEPVFIKAQDDK